MARVGTGTEYGLGQQQLNRIAAPAMQAVEGAPPSQLTGFAKAAESVADSGAHMLAVQQAVADRDAMVGVHKTLAEEQLAQIQASQADEQSGATGQPDYTKNRIAAFEKRKAELLQGVQGPARASLEESLIGLQGRIFAGASEAEGRARLARTQADLTTAQQATLNAVLIDPTTADSALESQRQLIEASGLPPEAKSKLMTGTASAIAQAKWQGLGTKDPRGALKELQTNADIPGLEYGDRVALTRQFEADIARQDAEGRARHNEWLSVKRDEVRFAIDVMDKGLPVANLDKLRSSVRGTELAGPLKIAEDTAHFAQTFALMSPAEQASQLEGLKAEPQTQATLPKVIAASKALQQSTHEATPDVQFAIQTLQNGQDPAGLTDLQARVKGTDLEEPLQQALAAREFASGQGATQTVEQQAASLQALQQAEQSPGSQAKLAAAAKVLQATASAIKDGRGLDRAEQLGLIRTDKVDLTDPDSVAARVSASKQASFHFGVPVQILKPEEMAGISAQMNKMTGDQLPDYLAKIQEATGEAYPQVMAELSAKGGIPRAAKYASLLTDRPDAGPVRNAMIEALQADPKDLKTSIDRAKASDSSFSEAKLDVSIAQSLQPFMNTVGATYAQGSGGVGSASAMTADITDAVKSTALVLMRTRSPDEAVQMATDQIINGRYEFRDTYRIPKPPREADAFVADVDRKIATRERNLTPETIDPRGSVAGVDEKIRRQAYFDQPRHWLTLPDESGLVLADIDGNAVLSGGKPIVVPFRSQN